MDIDILPPKTLHALYMYVVKDTKWSPNDIKRNSSKAQPKPKKKREVLSADAQNRKIAELEAKLGNFHDSKSTLLVYLGLLLGKPQAESDSEDESDDEISSDSD